MLRKIISGGQTGADQGGLIAGSVLKLETGGTAPPGWITDAGPAPWLHTIYDMEEGELDSKVYPNRTRKNVRDSDGTLWVGRPTSPGGKLTLSYATKQAKPVIINPRPEELSEWLAFWNISVLNVAGNRERTNPGIQTETIALLTAAIKP